MIGILVVSHGRLAQELLETAKLFLGEAPQAAALTLDNAEDADSFRIRMTQAVLSLDAGEGVLILADLFGGTPCNCAMALLSHRVRLLTGVNLPMLIEALSSRESIDSLPQILETGRQGILCPGAQEGAEPENEDF